MFDPKTNRFPYTLDTGTHYLKVKKNDGTVFDKNYPYVDTSRSFRLRQGLSRIILRLVVFPVVRVRLGLKVRGRENLKKYRDVIDKGVVSCCNHVHMWDYLSILCGIKPRRANVISWAPNISGENGKMIRIVGGIPIPENDIRASVSFVKSIKGLLDRGGWLHVYPEGSMWEFYAPIRPFKHGAANLACRFGRPIIPLAFSYREPGFIRGRIFRQIAKLTLNIGEPIWPDASLEPAERELDLTRRVHEAICRLAGFGPGENIYPPIYDDSKRIDYYTTEYGIGYKGSH